MINVGNLCHSAAIEQAREEHRSIQQILSELTGVSAAEIEWTFRKLRHLIQVDKLDKDKAMAIVRREAVSKPWHSESRSLK